MMLASRRREVQDLNRAARAALVERGEVRADGIEIDGHVFAVGDSVMALSNRRRLDITNGDRGVITDVNPARTEVTVQLDRGHAVTLPETYLRAGHLTYAYATTIHKARASPATRATPRRRQHLQRGRLHRAHPRPRTQPALRRPIRGDRRQPRTLNAHTRRTHRRTDRRAYPVPQQEAGHRPDASSGTRSGPAVALTLTADPRLLAGGCSAHDRPRGSRRSCPETDHKPPGQSVANRYSSSS